MIFHDRGNPELITWKQQLA